MTLSREEMILKRRQECLEYDAFDRRYGIDTKNPVTEALDALGGIRPISIPNHIAYPGSNGYMGISQFELDIINQALIDFRVNLSEYSFVDVGSGKGKAIFYNIINNSKYKKYLGIEIDSTYNDIAISNLLSLSPLNLVVDFLCINALDYVPKNEKTVYFLFQPFNKDIYKKFINSNSETFLKNNTFIINVAPYDNGNLDNLESDAFKDFYKVFSLEYISIYSSWLQNRD